MKISYISIKYFLFCKKASINSIRIIILSRIVIVDAKYTKNINVNRETSSDQSSGTYNTNLKRTYKKMIMVKLINSIITIMSSSYFSFMQIAIVLFLYPHLLF